MDNDSNSDREGSPDWLRTFQTPAPFTTLSSSSPSTSSHGAKDRLTSSIQSHGKLDPSLDDDSKDEINSARSLEKRRTIRAAKVVDLDSDSDQSKRKKKFSPGVKLNKEAGSVHSNKKQSKKVQNQATVERKEGEELQDKDEDLLKAEGLALPEEDGQERRTKRALSTLPLVLGDKVHRSKVLLEYEGDALDVSGDAGAIGRLNVTANQGNDFLLDLKGVIYKATIVPSNTFFVVNIGQTEAKVEAIMSDFVQLQPSVNVFESETMVEGTLDGFGFDSDEDFNPAAAGVTKLGDESKEEKKQAKPKARSNKPLKASKGLVKKAGKTKSSKASGKGGGTRKNVKKTNTAKRSGK